jgi:hypothetical protein
VWNYYNRGNCLYLFCVFMTCSTSFFQSDYLLDEWSMLRYVMNHVTGVACLSKPLQSLYRLSAFPSAPALWYYPHSSFLLELFSKTLLLIAENVIASWKSCVFTRFRNEFLYEQQGSAKHCRQCIIWVFFLPSAVRRTMPSNSRLFGTHNIPRKDNGMW